MVVRIPRRERVLISKMILISNPAWDYSNCSKRSFPLDDIPGCRGLKREISIRIRNGKQMLQFEQFGS